MTHRRILSLTLLATFVFASRAAQAGERLVVWRNGTAACRLVLPATDDRAAQLVRSTISGYLRQALGADISVATDAPKPDNCIVAGTPDTTPILRRLVEKGLKLTADDIGDEGYQLLTHEAEGARHVVVYGRTPRALKHGCQELLFYRTAATTRSIEIDWPLNVVMKPAFPYRGAYMLPCWSAHDSFESWQRVLRFHSELTLNRNWFWLDGFPIAGHTGEYAGTALASEKNVQSLIDLANAEDMKFLIGGGWFNWHHEKAVGKDYARGRDYYLAYLKAFRGFRGFYIEPTGEGAEIKNWRPECDALRDLIARVLKERPDFEFAIAIGKFNNAEYLTLMRELDPKRVYWWWCWGDPIRDKALDLYPSVLRWHIITKMADYHGSVEAPRPSERPLQGVVTSYDPGQGFGNPWEGWGKLGFDKPRDFHPHNIPFFAHQYLYRERSWDPDLTEAAFVARLHRRLFDADAPADSGGQYWRLSKLTLEYNAGRKPTSDQLAPTRTFLDALRGRTFTPRTADAIGRMEAAVAQLAKIAAK